jgi:hypothetical protein
MEENRFLRAYQEHKREKEQNSPNYNNRFACLKEDQRLKPDAGRFDCLKGDNYVSNQDVRVRDSDNRFACLASDGYQSYPRQEPQRVHYLPRPEPRESVNSQMRRYREERKVIEPPKPPVFSFESNYHFPELGKKDDTTKEPPKAVKLPEPKAPKEMIVNTVMVPIQKPTMTVMSLKGGKLISKEVFEDGTEVPESGIVMIKKPNYSSWASVLKPESKETIFYDLDEKKIIDNSAW